jgi:hypothetical protein
MSESVDETIAEVATGTSGVLCHLNVTFPEGVRGKDDHDLFQVYLVTDGRIAEIQRFDDRRSAAETAGLTA